MSIYDKSSLVLIPSGTKTGKVYSQKPVSGDGDFTFTRSSAATRVNADGFIEKETQNLLLQSNTFDTTWINSNSTETGGQSGYDGTNDAWLINKSAANGYIRQAISQSGVQTLSVYAKAGTLDWMRVIADGGSSTPSTWFDLANGVIGTADFFTIDSNIESVGSGWYRCSITFEVGTIAGVRFYPADGNNDVSGTSGNIYIQDAQLNQGLIAQEVITTTTTAVEGGITDNVPRLDYTDSSCPALLLEPQRTNLFTYSEYFGGWSLGGTTTPTLTANYAKSAEGVDNAYRVQLPNLATDNILFQSISHTTGVNMSISAWVKSASGSNESFKLFGDYGTPTGRSATLIATNEWQRFTFTFTPTGTGNRNAGLINVSNTAADLLVYGMQIEEASYATSYIPTYGNGSVTRVADTCTKTGISSLIGQTEGTMFAEFIMPATGASFSHYRLSTSGGLYNDSQNITLTATNTIRGWSFTSAVQQSSIESGVFSEGTKVKVAYAYKANDFVLYINGTQIGTDTSGSVPSSMSEFLVGSYYPNTSVQVINKTHQTALFKTRLTNEELAALTTI